jgi:superoxide dismutase
MPIVLARTRPKFIETVLANLVNWDFVNQTLAG